MIVKKGASNMKFGVYFTYWINNYIEEFNHFIPRAKRCGLDILEVGAFDFYKQNDDYFKKMRHVAEENEIILTAGYGPSRANNIATDNSSERQNALNFYRETFRKMSIANIHSIGGALYSYWPVDAKENFDKEADFKRSVAGMKILADIASDYDIVLNMEALNRFEGYLINVADEAVRYVNEVDRPNVKIMLDTFHMNIEEESFTAAIKTAGSNLGHFHVGEANRRPPRPGRMPWKDIGNALKDINYDGNIVLEPFVKMGGQVGKDIRVWRDLSSDADEEKMDADLKASVEFLHTQFD